jgi:hypothetical protein
MNDPEYLWHYTDFAGLKGIIESKSLWFTDYRSLNDTSEFKASKPFLCEIIKDEIIAINKDIDIKILDLATKQIWEIFVEDKHPNAYLFCLCVHNNEFTQENGLLSMWRGYGPNGGYSLVFNKQNLIEFLRVQATHSLKAQILDEKVEYPLEIIDFSLELNKHLNTFKTFAKKEIIPSCVDNFRNLNITFEYYEAFLHLVTLIKHSGFNEENEYRICLFELGKDYIPEEEKNSAFKKEIRKRGSNIVNYIERPIEIEGLVKKIIIGPQRDSKLKKELLEGYLLSKDLNIEVKVSDIPYLTN